MAITMEIGGQAFTEFTDITVTRAMDQVTGTFVFEAAVHPPDPFPFPRGAAVQVKINNTIVLTGYVDVTTVDYSSSKHVITMTGRDKTGDIVDSKLDGLMELKAPVDLETVVQKTLEDIGATDVQVINKVPDLQPFTKKELVSGKVGMGAFEFMDKYAAKRQVILATDGQGNIVITRASDELTDIVIRNEIDQPNNNIKCGAANFNDVDRYNEYTFYAQANHAADPNDEKTPKNGSHIHATATDEKIRPSRKFRAIGEGSQDTDKLQDRAEWEKNIREARSFTYHVTMAQHSPYSYDGEPYQPNTLIHVTDEFCDVDADLLIIRTTHKLSNSHGSITELELMSRGAYLLLHSTAPDTGKGKGKGKGADDSKYANYDNSSSNYFSQYNDKVT